MGNETSALHSGELNKPPNESERLVKESIARQILTGVNREKEEMVERTTQMVEELTQEGLGRAIVQVVSRQTDATELNEEQVMAKTLADTKGLEYKPKALTEESQLLGIVLPCNKENNEHAVILVDGSVFITEPPSHQGFHAKYKQAMGPSENPIKTRSDLSDTKHSLRTSEFFNASSDEHFLFKMTASSDQPEQQELIRTKTRAALELAREIKVEKERSVQETAHAITGIYKELFHPNQPPPPPQPEQPPDSLQQD